MSETVYKLKFSRPGRYWFVGKDENDLFVWDRNNEQGFYGENRTFRIGEGDGALVTVKGPFAASKESFEQETGEKYEISDSDYPLEPGSSRGRLRPIGSGQST